MNKVYKFGKCFTVNLYNVILQDPMDLPRSLMRVKCLYTGWRQSRVQRLLVRAHNICMSAEKGRVSNLRQQYVIKQTQRSTSLYVIQCRECDTWAFEGFYNSPGDASIFIGPKASVTALLAGASCKAVRLSWPF